MPQASAGRSLRRRRPAAPCSRAEPSQAATRIQNDSVARQSAGRSFVLWQLITLVARSRSDRQPAAAPWRRAAPLCRRPVRSAAGWPCATRIGPSGQRVAARFKMLNFESGICGSGKEPPRAAASRRRRPAARVPKVRFERALRRLRPNRNACPSASGKAV